MNNISEIGKACCGCRACAQSCSLQAIRFEEDLEGFMQPLVDEGVCVGCGKCLKACPVNIINVYKYEQQGYAAKIRNVVDLSKSASGGVFYALAKLTLELGGVVCGCSVDVNLMPHHVIAKTLDEVKSMRGSKYVQSNMNDIYAQVKEYLKQGVRVLFTGVPCQVAGLRNFLGIDYDNLICIDIICHGVPSRKMYCEYLRWLETKWNGKILSYAFRSKKRHQWSLTLEAKIRKNNGKIVYLHKMASLDPYYYNFLKGNIYRESCYICSYSQQNRPGDITIGDFWGIEHTHPELFDINGVSCVLINSPKGDRFWGKLSEVIEMNKVAIDDIVNYNGNLRTPTKRPIERDDIYRLLTVGGFEAIPYNLSWRSKFIDEIKNCIPNKWRFFIKPYILPLLSMVRKYL